MLDSPLGETNGVNGQSSDTDKVINEILGISLPVPTREWLYSYMTERGYSTAIQQWLGSNLVGTRGGFKWAFDISGVPPACHALLETAARRGTPHVDRTTTQRAWQAQCDTRSVGKHGMIIYRYARGVVIMQRCRHW